MDLLIDTDMGGDIDDALALSMALKDDSIHVRGITTVYTANAWRTDLVRRMVRVYRRDALVYAGADAMTPRISCAPRRKKGRSPCWRLDR